MITIKSKVPRPALLVNNNLKLPSFPLLLLSVPLFNPGSALLTPFPSGTPAQPKTVVPSPSTTIISPVPVPAPPPTPSVISMITVPVTPVIVPSVTQANTPTPAPTSLIPAIPLLKLPPQIPRNHLDVHEITITPAVTVVLLVLAARGFPKIR